MITLNVRIALGEFFLYLFLKGLFVDQCVGAFAPSQDQTLLGWLLLVVIGATALDRCLLLESGALAASLPCAWRP